jgi:thioredoxin reductase
MDEVDVVVVGGGAAGLSGAVALARSRRSVLVVDAGEPRNTPAHGVHNLLGQEGRSPAELLDAGRDELRAYGRAVDGRLSGVRLADGSVVPREVLVVAPGFTARSAILVSPGIEPEELRMGDTVLGTAVPTGPDGATSVPAVWVAGNVADLRAQVVNAATRCGSPCAAGR